MENFDRSRHIKEAAKKYDCLRPEKHEDKNNLQEWMHLCIQRECVSAFKKLWVRVCPRVFVHLYPYSWKFIKSGGCVCACVSVCVHERKSSNHALIYFFLSITSWGEKIKPLIPLQIDLLNLFPSLLFFGFVYMSRWIFN